MTSHRSLWYAPPRCWALLSGIYIIHWTETTDTTKEFATWQKHVCTNVHNHRQNVKKYTHKLEPIRLYSKIAVSLVRRKVSGKYHSIWKSFSKGTSWTLQTNLTETTSLLNDQLAASFSFKQDDWSIYVILYFHDGRKSTTNGRRRSNSFSTFAIRPLIDMSDGDKYFLLHWLLRFAIAWKRETTPLWIISDLKK